ncbi:hypothetical protein AVEN_105459-1 [Araneus ventricosus]|uniref:Uncharacterized protein n=1 Tax=Araneus ventricosus TaxID=182803 RepID=A0A4Y2Q6V1_ARAVE|nr:hypothetical protein AVEN_105459-1 [Araneus ventricosus]
MTNANTVIAFSWSFKIFIVRYCPVRSQLKITECLDFMEWIENVPRLGCFSTIPERNSRARNVTLHTHPGPKSKDEQVDDQTYAVLFFISGVSSTKCLGDNFTRSTNNSTVRYLNDCEKWSCFRVPALRQCALSGSYSH